jgi:hypothetical protein
MNAPKLFEFKKKYRLHNILNKVNKSHTYSINQYNNNFNKFKHKYFTSKSKSYTNNKYKGSLEDYHNSYNKFRFYYNENKSYYNNKHNYSNNTTKNSFNKFKYYYHSNIYDKKNYITKSQAIKEEIDDVIENRFITIFLLKLYHMAILI